MRFLIAPAAFFMAAATNPMHAPDAPLPNVYGSVVLSVSTTPLDIHLPQVWMPLRPDAKMRALVSRLRHADPAVQLAEVNREVNRRITFVEDVTLYGSPDYWAPASLTMRRNRGDCEDYVILKRQLLRLLGFPGDRMVVAVVRDVVRQGDHALLLVYHEGTWWVLDNLTNHVAEARGTGYRPMLSYAPGRSWVHGFPISRTETPQ